MAKSKLKTAVTRAGTKTKSVVAKKPAARGAKTVKASAVKAAKPAKAKAAKPVKAAKAVKSMTRTVTKADPKTETKAATKTATVTAAKAAKPVVVAAAENPPVPAEAVSAAPTPAIVKETVREIAPRLPLTLPKRDADQPKGQAAAPAANTPPPVVKPAPKPVQSLKPQQQRADIPPTTGFTLVVDGHFKNQYDDVKAAKSAGAELLGKFPMLRVEIYDAAHKKRMPV